MAPPLSPAWINKAQNQQPDRREWAVGVGDQTIRTWVVPIEDAAALKVALVADGAVRVTQTDDGATSTVAATYPDDRSGPPNTNPSLNITWELLGNDLMKDLRTHKDLEPSSDSERKDVNAAFEAVAAGTAIVSTWCAKAQTIFKLLSKGTTDYLLTQYVIRKTIKLTDGAGVKASLTGVNKVEPPTGITGSPFTVPVDDGDDASQYRWLKKPPSVTYLGIGKFAITQEWWGGKWSAGLYGGVATP